MAVARLIQMYMLITFTRCIKSLSRRLSSVGKLHYKEYIPSSKHYINRRKGKIYSRTQGNSYMVGELIKVYPFLLDNFSSQSQISEKGALVR